MILNERYILEGSSNRQFSMHNYMNNLTNVFIQKLNVSTAEYDLWRPKSTSEYLTNKLFFESSSFRASQMTVIEPSINKYSFLFVSE